jgi:hypothetical protein
MFGLRSDTAHAVVLAARTAPMANRDSVFIISILKKGRAES